jgi:hypothetical protein
VRFDFSKYGPHIVRPLTALLGIVMGSAVALATGLLMTWIVILFLPADEARFAPEHAPLLRAVAVFTLFSATSAGSFYGELRGRSWRPAAHGATLVMLAVAVWMYWPK